MIASGLKGERISDTTYRPCKKIVLADNRIHTFVVEAYCLDFEKDNPTQANKFVISETDPDTLRFIWVAKQERLSMNTIQAALWIRRSSIDEQGLLGRFNVTAEEVKRAKAFVATFEEREDAKSTTKQPPSIGQGNSQDWQLRQDITYSGALNLRKPVQFQFAAEPPHQCVGWTGGPYADGDLSATGVAAGLKLPDLAGL